MLDRKKLMVALEKKEAAAQAEEYRNDVIARTEDTDKFDVRDAQNQGWYQMGIRHAHAQVRTEIIVGDYHG